jgi:predicted PurR-regulated permease PerM
MSPAAMSPAAMNPAATHPARASTHEAAAPTRELGELLAPPRWLRQLGRSSWWLAGIALITVATVSVLALTQAIVMPLIAAAVIAAVASPIVAWLKRHRIGRGLGAALVLLGLALLAAAIVLLVIGGVLSQSGDLSGHLSSAQDTLAGWLRDLGVSPGEADDAKAEVGNAATTVVPALLGGLIDGISAFSSLAFFLALTALSLFFLLKDGPAIRTRGEQHAGVPEPIARVITGRVLQSLRGYFVGVTAVAAFNAVLIGVGALLLGVPLAGTIAIVTFVGAYIPYIGAWAAGIFAVLVALGGAGNDAAVAMAVLALLANGLLQQMVQPIAYGAALGIHPLAVLIVTIAGGSLFGAAGLILAAPLTSAITRISTDLAATRGQPERGTAIEEPSTP